MYCISALHTQIITLLSVPHEIIFLQHKVFREYAKIAVGPDFIHTFPSFIILVALAILFWKNPPTFKWVHEDHIQTPIYKGLQMLFSWVCVNAILWLWLVFQRLLYCSVWANWSYETEYRDFVYPWWQRVWSSYYPQPLRPPLFSAGFISWILAMVIATCFLGCAISIERMRLYLHETSAGIREMKITSKTYLTSLSNKLKEATASFEKTTILDESEMSSVCEDCASEISTDGKNHIPRHDVHPICNGTDWYSMTAQRKNSLKSMRTSKTITGECPEGENISPRIVRYHRGCHTVPSTSSDKSSC